MKELVLVLLARDKKLWLKRCTNPEDVANDLLVGLRSDQQSCPAWLSDVKRREKDLLDTAKRLVVEAGVEGGEISKVAEKLYYMRPFESKNSPDTYVTVFMCERFIGEPVNMGSVEPLTPYQLYPTNQLPWSEMFDDDLLWLPDVLQRKKVHIRIAYTFNHKEHRLENFYMLDKFVSSL